MSLYLDTQPGWFAVLAVIVGVYTLVFLSRKHRGHHEIVPQLLFGCATLVFAFLIELIGISAQLWNYSSGNWPIILWVAYFSSGLTAFQMAKRIEEMTRR